MVTLKEEENMVVHLSRQISESIYDHNIDEAQWSQWMSYLDDLPLKGPFQRIERQSRVYHLRSLVYEFDPMTQVNRCYCDENHPIEFGNIRGSDYTFLIYQRHRTTYQYPFQPVNSYHEIVDQKHLVVSYPTCQIEFLRITSDDQKKHEVMIFPKDMFVARETLELIQSWLQRHKI